MTPSEDFATHQIKILEDINTPIRNCRKPSEILPEKTVQDLEEKMNTLVNYLIYEQNLAIQQPLENNLIGHLNRDTPICFTNPPQTTLLRLNLSIEGVQSQTKSVYGRLQYFPEGRVTDVADSLNGFYDFTSRTANEIIDLAEKAIENPFYPTK